MDKAIAVQVSITTISICPPLKQEVESGSIMSYWSEQ